MTSSRPALESDALDELERRLTAQGYVLRREPRGDTVPQFLGTFTPDAIATGRSPNLVVEVIAERGVGEAKAAKIKQLQQLLESHPDWKLQVLYAPVSAPTPAVASVEAIRQRLNEVRPLTEADRPAALVLAWSLLEAVARRILPEQAGRPLTPATTIELLASLGHLDQSEANRLREAARARNLIVHGDVGQDVPRLQLDAVLNIADRLIAHLERETSGAA